MGKVESSGPFSQRRGPVPPERKAQTLSSRVILVSVVLTATLAAAAIILLSPGETGAGGDFGEPGVTSSSGGNSSSGTASAFRDPSSPNGTTESSDPTALVNGTRPTNGSVTWRDNPRGPSGSSRTSINDRTGGTSGSGGTRVDAHGFPIGNSGGAVSSGGTSSRGSTSGTRNGSRRGSSGNGSSTDGSAGTSGTAADGTTAESLGENITVQGTILTVDTGGNQFPAESGTLEMRITGPGLDQVREVAISSGSWSVVVPERAEIRFTGALISERRAVVSPAAAVIASEGARFELVAEWTSQTVLQVRSRETGEILCDLTLLRIPDWMRNSRPHPGAPVPTDQSWTAECSPIPLSSEGANSGMSVPYHVHSPGYAWGRILLDTTTGGEREIMLDPGGVLDLAFEGGWDRPGATLRIRETGEIQPYAEVPVSGEQMVINGILPGEYQVSVETGSWAQNPLVLGSTDITIVAGEVNPILLPVATLEDEERVTFAGSVFVPNAWLLDEFQLRLRPVDPGRNVSEETQHIPSLEMTATEDALGVLYEWEAEPVEPGNFGMLILPIGYGINVNVPEEGLFDAQISLPPPMPVEITTIVAGTEEPAYPGLIRWTPAREAGVPGAGASSVFPIQGTNIFQFDAPIGH